MKRIILLGGLTLAGCTPEVEDPDTSCSSLADCDFGFVCSNSRCVPERDNAAQGEFRCVVGGTTSTSTVTAVVQGNHYPVNATVECTPSTDALIVGFGSPSTVGDITYTLNVILPWQDAQNARSHLMVPPDSSGQPNSANVMEFVSYDFSRVVAYSIGGVVVLDGPAIVGQELSGSVEIDLLSTPYDDFIGTPCPYGIANCTDDLTLSSSIFCLRDPNDEFSPICVSECETDADCALYGCACFNGYCLRECATNADCVSPLRCTDLAGRWGCVGL